MKDELIELLDMAIYKEIASQALYIAAQSKTRDAGAKALLKELAKEEVEHTEGLKRLRDEGVEKRRWHREQVPDLKISEYLTGADTIEGAGLQETLLFAMKREQQAIEFYSRMTGVTRDEEAKQLCQRLAQEELKHKVKLEKFYDELFYSEN